MKPTKSQYVRDLRDQDRVSSYFLVKSCQLGTGKTGKPFLSLVLQDKTGEVDARIWDNAGKYSGTLGLDALVQIEGNIQVFQGRLQVIIRDLTLLRETDVVLEDLLVVSALDADALYAEIVQKISAMKDPHYKALCESVFIEDADIVSRFRRAPAAKTIHHAYPIGLLEHVVSVCEILDRIGKHYGEKVNHDLLLVGGLFHDIAKIWELQYEKSTDYTDEGRFLGHLVMGVELIDRKVKELNSIPGRLPEHFPEDKLLLAKHMVVAHHGKLEYGSPKEPVCVEALIVNMIDDLDSKVNQLLKFIENDPQPGAWSGIQKHFGRYFYKPEWARKVPLS
jgi:3'-5' exoribonuclease